MRQTSTDLLCQEDLKICRIVNDDMMEQDAVQIVYEADVTANLLDSNGKKRSNITSRHRSSS